ncbi:hypothetical protein F4813DRAFT_393446 [Daldinia decipiens]|uniref:uncharacterized protein n=1 Tax=Daldinia decipiens TaxID=326647 RepID=UPI0020C37C9C|nr:uncharacterized protein F4813DRAFT_393446 [Daldinia decipiens]KAI1653680.1 hypothetical protein F4813DRAFT_393446 [Daldinia decipiens]
MSQGHNRRPDGRPVCVACNSKVSRIKAPCTRPVEGHGCTGCKQYGLPCVFDGVPLPPYPGPTRAPILSTCDQCGELGLRCDFKRPCDRCHNSGAMCTGNTRYCFTRGVPGDDMYGYYLNLGFGPNGVNQVLHSQMFSWTMPSDYHVQYMRWKNEGTVNSEVNNQVNNQVVQVHQDESLAIQYSRILELAHEAATHGVPVNLRGIMEVLNRDVVAGVPSNESQGARDLMYYLGKQAVHNPGAHERKIEISEYNILYNMDDLQRLNPGTQAEYSYVAPIRDTVLIPLTRPASPGPARPSYWIPWNTKSADIQVHDNTGDYPEGSPERVDMSAIRRDPFRDHPNENAQSVLSAIPFLRIWDEGAMYAIPRACQQEYLIDGTCGNLTTRGCEDTTHTGDSIPICDTCEDDNREKFYEEFASSALQMRQYFCHQCSGSIDSLLQMTANRGCDVYYDNFMRIPLPDFTSPSLINTGLTRNVGGWRGSPLEVTGCSCGVKLLGRRLCSPHRLQHLLNLQEAVSDMKIYIESLYGKMVCPGCKSVPGINNYDFKGLPGGEGVYKAWACLACHGIVITENTTALLPRLYLTSGAPRPAPAPYGIRAEELEIAKDKLREQLASRLRF